MGPGLVPGRSQCLKGGWAQVPPGQRFQVFLRKSKKPHRGAEALVFSDRQTSQNNQISEHTVGPGQALQSDCPHEVPPRKLLEHGIPEAGGKTSLGQDLGSTAVRFQSIERQEAETETRA